MRSRACPRGADAACVINENCKPLARIFTRRARCRLRWHTVHMRFLRALLLGLVFVSMPSVACAQSLAWPVPYLIGGLGPTFLIGRDKTQPRAALAVDLKLSLPIRLGAGYGIVDSDGSLSGVLVPELGVAYFTNNRALFQVGLGGGYGDYLRGFVIYQPRFLAGRVDNLAAVGIRHGFSACFFFNGFHVEVAHQAIYVLNGAWQHDVLLMFSMADPLSLLIHHIYHSLKGRTYS